MQQSGASGKQKIAEARHKFNEGKIAEAEKLANECKKLGMRTRMFGDSPEKLLEDIKICKTQEAAWRKDNSSIVAKRGRSNYLVMRARTVLEEGDVANSHRLLPKPNRSISSAHQAILNPSPCGSNWPARWVAVDAPPARRNPTVQCWPIPIAAEAPSRRPSRGSPHATGKCRGRQQPTE